jgi:SH3-like domain-containing protein
MDSALHRCPSYADLPPLRRIIDGLKRCAGLLSAPWAAVTVAIALAVLAAPVHAQSMVSVNGNLVNLRTAPNTNAQVSWQLKRGYPLQVIKRQGEWLEVRDFENDTGWISRRVVGNTAHHIVKAKVANLRSGPGTQHKQLGQAKYGEVLKTLEHRSNWVRVQRANGSTAWVAQNLVWGW